MAQYAKLPSGEYAKFPDEWTKEQIDETVYRDFADQFPDRGKSVGDVVSAGAETFLNAIPSVDDLSAAGSSILDTLSGAATSTGEWLQEGAEFAKEVVMGDPMAEFDAVAGKVPEPTAREQLAAAGTKLGAAVPEWAAGIADFGIEGLEAGLGGLAEWRAGKERADVMREQVLEPATKAIESIYVTPYRDFSKKLTEDADVIQQASKRGTFGRGLIDAGSSAGHTLASLAGGRKNALQLMFADVAGNQIPELEKAWDDPEAGPMIRFLKDQGMSNEGAFIVSSLYGTSEVIAENKVLDQLFKKWGKNWVGELARFVALETGQETLTETLQAGLDKLTTDPNMTWGEFKQRYRDLYASLPISLAATAGPVKVAQYASDTIQGREAHKREQEWLQSIADEQARMALSPDTGIDPRQTTVRPTDVGPAAAPATGRAHTDAILDELNQQIQQTQALAQAGEEQRAQAEEVQQAADVLDEIVKQQQIDQAYAQREAQMQAEREADLPAAQVQQAEEESEGVDVYQAQAEEFEEARKPAMAQAYEDAIDRSLAEEFKKLPKEGPGTVDMAEPEEGPVKLVHYSRQAGLTEIDPVKHGTGIKGEETKRKRNDPQNWVDRSYFFIGEPAAEQKDVMLGQERYEVEVDMNTIYDARRDPEGLKAGAMDNGRLDLTRYEKAIKDAGYRGYWTETDQQGRVAAVFETTPLRPEKSVSVLGQEIAEKHGIDLVLAPSRGRIAVSSIAVPEGRRGQGVGSAAINDIKKAADERGVPVVLEPESKALEGFYSGLGFVRDGDVMIYTPGPRVVTDRPGGQTAEFFTKMTLGEDGKPDVEYKPLLEGTEGGFNDEYQQHRGNFDDHIRASIPGFAEVQIKTGQAVADNYGPDAEILDVGASEGSWIKAISAQSGANTTGIEPLGAMVEHFENTTSVPGSRIVRKGWGAGWTEADGTEIKPFTSTQKYDVVHEAMTFQFIDNNRAEHIAGAKKFMKPDGILLTEEKFKDDGSPEYKQREQQKDQYKGQYFTEKAIKDKAKETLAVGMNDNMVTKAELEQILRDEFDYVVEYWSAGNFGGYVSSDSKAAIDKFLASVGDTNSEYSANPTPRWVSEEALPAQLREQPDDQIAVGPQEPGRIPDFLKPQALETARGATGGELESLRARSGAAQKHEVLSDDLVAIPPVKEIKEDFDSTLHVIEDADVELAKAYAQPDAPGNNYRFVNEVEHDILRGTLTALEQTGFPTRGATLGVRFFMVGDYAATARQSAIPAEFGNRAFISVSEETMDPFQFRGDSIEAELSATSFTFSITHELGHSVDMREADENGEKYVGFSETSPLFRLDDPSAGDMGPVIKEMWEAYLDDKLGLHNLLHYPFGKMAVFDTHKRHIQLESFAQLFGLYYTYGRSKKGGDALREIMPNAMAFMEEIHDALETANTTLDERDRAIREIFGRDPLQRDEVDAPGGYQLRDTQRPQEEAARPGVPEVQDRGPERGEGVEALPARDQLLTTSNADYNADAGGPEYQQYPEDQEPQSPGFTVPDEGLRDKVARKFHDKFQRLYKTQEAIREQGGQIDIDTDVWAAEERFHGKVEYDLRVFEEDYIEPLIYDMTEMGVSTEVLDEYLYARHAPERNAAIAARREDMPDGGSGMTNAEAKETRARLEKEFPKIEVLAQQVWAILGAKRNRMEQFSLLSSDTIDTWEDTYEYYVPLKGVAADALDVPEDTPTGVWQLVKNAIKKRLGRASPEAEFPRIGSGMSIKGKEAKAATGRTTRAPHILFQVSQDVTESMIRSRKNEVGQHLLNLVRDNPNPDFWQIYDEQNPDLEPTYRGGQVQMTPMSMSINPKYFGVKEGGKQYFIKLNDPRLAQAMQNLGVEKQGVYIRALSASTRFLSSINTALDPEFVVSNFSRDIQTAIYNALAEQDLHDAKVDTSKLARRMIKDVFPAMRPMHRALRRKAPREGNEFDQYALDFIEDGAKTGFFNMRDLEAQKRHIENLVKVAENGVMGKSIKVAKAVSDLVTDYNGTVENAVRLAAYKNARQIMEQRGIPADKARKRAAHLAKNLTVNFNRRGELSTALNAHYMFFNASVQGTAQFARTMLTLKKGPDGKRSLNFAQKVAMAAVAAGYLWAIINRARSDEDEDGRTYYDNIPASVKERNFIIMKGDGRDYWSIPLPYGYNVFHVMGTTVSDVAHGPRDPLDGAFDLTMAMLGSFNPMGMSVDEEPGMAAIKTVTPTLLTPGVELGFNSNFWGGKIWKEDRFNERTPDAALSMNAKPHFQAMAQWLNEVTGGSMYERGGIDVSPDSIEHIFEFATGGAGRFVSRSVGLAEKLAVGTPLKDNDIPFWRKISKEPAEYRASTKYYEIRGQVLAKDDALTNLRGPAKAEFRRENQEFMPVIRAVLRTDGRLQSIRARRDRELAKPENEGLVEQEQVKREYREKMDKEYNKVNRLWHETIDK